LWEAPSGGLLVVKELSNISGRRRGVGKFQKGQKVSGKKRDTPNRLTAVKGALAPILARDAKDIELIDAVGTPEFDRLLKAQEQEPWPDEWVNQLDVSTGPSVPGGGSGDDPRGAVRYLLVLEVAVGLLVITSDHHQNRLTGVRYPFWGRVPAPKIGVLATPVGNGRKDR
jgi:hypothetical protein